VTRALFLRHAQSVSNAHPEAAALPEAEGDRLSDLGREQAARAGEALGEQGATRLITSPMGRARETAAILNDSLALPLTELEYIHELREADDYTSLAPEDQKLRRWSERMPQHPDDPEYAEDGAESFAAVIGRVKRLKTELEAQPPVDLPMVVTHGLFLRFFLFHSLLGDDFGPGQVQLLWQARSLNCGLSIFCQGEHWHPIDPEIPGWSCITWMARPWDPPGLP
jgi:probable phosphoglycerate mutase